MSSYFKILYELLLNFLENQILCLKFQIFFVSCEMFSDLIVLYGKFSLFILYVCEVLQSNEEMRKQSLMNDYLFFCFLFLLNWVMIICNTKFIWYLVIIKCYIYILFFKIFYYFFKVFLSFCVFHAGLGSLILCLSITSSKIIDIQLIMSDFFF